MTSAAAGDQIEERRSRQKHSSQIRIRFVAEEGVFRSKAVHGGGGLALNRVFEPNRFFCSGGRSGFSDGSGIDEDDEGDPA